MIDDQRSNLEFDAYQAPDLDIKEFNLINQVLTTTIKNQWRDCTDQDELLKKWQHTFEPFGEIYARAGRLLLTGEHSSIFDNDLQGLSRFEQAYFYLHTAAALNNKVGRF